jgi:hypothetical protein
LIEGDLMSYAKEFLHDKGDLITILRDPPMQAHVSLKASTRATYSLVAREHYFEGLCEAEANLQGGEYFTLDSETYMVQTVNKDKESGQLFIYVARTNAEITVQRKSDAYDDNGNLISASWDSVISDLPVFVEIATRSRKQEDEGLLDQTIYTFQVSSSIGIKEMDRVIYCDKKLKVDSIDPTGMRGIVRIQLSPDFRP